MGKDVNDQCKSKDKNKHLILNTVRLNKQGESSSDWDGRNVWREEVERDPLKMRNENVTKILRKYYFPGAG